MKRYLFACVGLIIVALRIDAVSTEPVTMNFKVGGVERQALVFAPSGNTTGKVPLVFAFHGHGGNMNGFSRGAGLQNAWPEALVVYPQGLPIATDVDREGTKPGWQRRPGEVGDRDLKFVDAMVAKLREQYPVDEQRVFAVGFSNGAFFTYLLWAQRPQIFAAFAPVAGKSELTGGLTVPRPAVQIGGEADRLVVLADLKKAMATVRKLDGCSEQGEPCGLGCLSYSSSKGAPVVNWIHPGPHMYPPRATPLIVNFLKKQALGEAAPSAANTPLEPAATEAAPEMANEPDERADPSAKHVQSDVAQAFRKNALPVTFPSNGLTLQGWIYKPSGEGPFPAIIWNHGSEKDPGAHPELAMFYTSHGYVLFLPIRRGHGASPGTYFGDALTEYRNRTHERALVMKEAVTLQGEDNKDVVAALAWLKQQPYVDGRRIAVTGVSFGGIQTLLTAEKGLGVRCFIPFAPGAMSWANTQLQAREIEAVRNAKAPLFLIQSRTDYNLGPSEVLGPIIREKGGINRAKLYPPFGTTHAEGHGGFASWEEGIAIWGNDVLEFLTAAGMGPTQKS